MSLDGRRRPAGPAEVEVLRQSDELKTFALDERANLIPLHDGLKLLREQQSG